MCLSTAEAEYIAVTEATKDVACLASKLPQGTWFSWVFLGFPDKDKKVQTLAKTYVFLNQNFESNKK